VYPVPSDPVKASLGILKGRGTFQEFLRERNEERAKELARERKEDATRKGSHAAG
jgi:hypothetical protein